MHERERETEREAEEKEEEGLPIDKPTFYGIMK